MAIIEKRENANGSISFRVKIRMKGYPVQSATFKRLTDAKIWAQHTESAIREGRHFKTAEAKKHTLSEMIVRYQKSVLPTKPKSIEKQTKQLDWWKDKLGAYLLSDITPSLLAEYRDKLSQEEYEQGKVRASATIVRYMAALSHAFTIAVNEWGWLEDSPMRKVRKPKEPRGRIRFLDNDERARLLEACRNSSNQFLYPVVLLALSTGMRKSEIMNLKWEQVNLNQGSITLYETKNGDIRKVPLVLQALEEFKRMNKLRRIDTNLVFPTDKPLPKTKGAKAQDIRHTWKTAVRAAGLHDFRFHDLRHSCASYLAMNGASLAEIAEVLGHKTLQMVKRYAHLSEAHTAKVVERMNKEIFG